MPDLLSMDATGLESLLKSILTGQNEIKIVQQEILQRVKKFGEQGEEHFAELEQALAHKSERLLDKAASKADGDSRSQSTQFSAPSSATLGASSQEEDEAAMSIDEPEAAATSPDQAGFPRSGTPSGSSQVSRVFDQQSSVAQENTIDEDARVSGSDEDISTNPSASKEARRRFMPYVATGRPSHRLRKPTQNAVAVGVIRRSRKAVRPIRGGYSCLTQSRKHDEDEEVQMIAPTTQVPVHFNTPLVNNMPSTIEEFENPTAGQNSCDKAQFQDQSRVSRRRGIDKELRWLQTQSEQAGMSSGFESPSRRRASTIGRSRTRFGDTVGNEVPSLTPASVDQDTLTRASPLNRHDHDLEAVNESPSSIPISMNEQSNLPAAAAAAAAPASGKFTNSTLETDLGPDEQGIAQTRTRKSGRQRSISKIPPGMTRTPDFNNLSTRREYGL